MKEFGEKVFIIMKGTTDRQLLQTLQENLNKYMLTDPLFMLFCPQKSKRADFCNKYFSYYLEKWQKKGCLIISESKKTAVTLIDPNSFKYKISGKNALPLKLSGNAGNVFIHQKAVQSITDIIIPAQMEKRILTIYGNPAENLDEILSLTEECMQKAKEEGFILVYETLSRKLVPLFEKKDFEINYAKQFMNTQFFQTVMTYNF